MAIRSHRNCKFKVAPYFNFRSYRNRKYPFFGLALAPSAPGLALAPSALGQRPYFRSYRNRKYKLAPYFYFRSCRNRNYPFFGLALAPSALGTRPKTLLPVIPKSEIQAGAIFLLPVIPKPEVRPSAQGPLPAIAFWRHCATLAVYAAVRINL